VAFGSERAVRIMNIDALETRRAHCERELVAGAQRDEALSMLVRSGPVEMERYGQEVCRHTLARWTCGMNCPSASATRASTRELPSASVRSIPTIAHANGS